MRRLLFAFAALTVSCGYRPLHGGDAEREKLHVTLAHSSIPEAVASDEVLVGVREELSRLSSLAPGDGYPRCEVEVLRADESAEGIAAVPNQDGRLVPSARATRVGIVARAWVVRAAGAPRERDTGDVRAMEVVSVAPDAKTATFQYAGALRAAGRRAGKRLGSKILGLPAASDE